jgi:hypothetical protein
MNIDRVLITCFLWGYSFSLAFSQNGEHLNSGYFVKRIEYNLIDVQLVTKVGDELKNAGYQCNCNSKSDMEKLLFGDIVNARVEFLYAPSFEASTKGEAGFRIVRDPLNKSCILEVKYIPNYEEVMREVNNKQVVLNIPDNIMDSIPFETKELLWKHTKAEQYKKRFNLFKVSTLSFPISDKFAKKLYEKMVSLIDNFKAKGASPMIFDGYSVTFRVVVDDEVWSLNIHEPRGDALKMSDFCRQIITDAETNTFDESKYIEVF